MTPILNASGCLDALTAPDVARALDAYVTKTVTLRPRAGNDPVRIAETDVGMLNSIGLQNSGLDVFAADVLPRLADLGVPVWVSVGGSSAAEYAELCGRLDSCGEVDVVELNLSCPNVEAPADGAAEIVAAARSATSKPLYAKLSPAVWDVGAVAEAAYAAGATGLSLVNTLRGLALDASLRPSLGSKLGGLSGPALKPIALAAVFACYRATPLPIVAMGGVQTGNDALEFIAAGASAIALGTVLFSDPSAPQRVRNELATVATERGFASPLDARGCAHALCRSARKRPQANVEAAHKRPARRAKPRF